MRVIETVAQLRAALDAGADRRSGTVGFVPTMGFLHEGHASLVRRARADSDTVVVSVFVNPTQFGPGEDFTTYPRDLPRDLEVLEREGTDVAFVPPAGELYPPGADTHVAPGAVAAPLEGERRPGHFAGVATVVTILLNAVRPQRAYFGEKDWQQLRVVTRMVRDLRLPVEIVGLPIVREPDGLAMSSRNVRLAPADRTRALCIPRALGAARSVFASGERDPAALEAAMAETLAREPGVDVDYAVVVDPESLLPQEVATEASRALVAARVGGVRLIDNVALGAADGMRGTPSV